MYAKTISAAQSVEAIQRNKDSLYFKPKTNTEELAILELKNTIESMAKRYRFNGEVLVCQNNRILTHSSFGFANPFQKENLEKGYRFQLASISKQFTAVAILELIAKGNSH